VTIEERLKEERKRLGFNQPDFAALAGKVKKTLIDYEKGVTSPDAKFLASIAAAGADVQYILTGIRSSAMLVPDERLLLDRYRTSPQELKDAALRVLLNGSQSQPPNAKFIVHGNIGQSVDTQTASHFTIDMRKERKKKE
jgi:transcriptional regulator with XRE-family HTH domain